MCNENQEGYVKKHHIFTVVNNMINIRSQEYVWGGRVCVCFLETTTLIMTYSNLS